jgi:hypothetical protein
LQDAEKVLQRVFPDLQQHFAALFQDEVDPVARLAKAISVPFT